MITGFGLGWIDRPNLFYLWASVCCHINQVIQARQLVMQDCLGVAASVPRKMLQEVSLGINPKQFACINLVGILTRRADTFLGDQVGHVAFPR